MSRAIDLVIADVDGTLVTDDKRLTPATTQVVAALREAGIRFAITSGRPPRGMRMLSKPLGIDTPLAGFNGGVMMAPDFSQVVAAHDLDDGVIGRAVGLLDDHGLDAWVYTHDRWLVRDGAAPHVARERRTVAFAPEIVGRFDLAALHGVVKIVGVTDDEARMTSCRDAARKAFGEGVTADCSQPYYLDITSTRANKGAVVDALAEHLGIPHARIATIGDMPNDVAMFARSGCAIAMGNAEHDVRRKAHHVTVSNDEDGFAEAMKRFVLEGRRG
ncbi:Cof-type HAD-IIB family hydrolase [Acidocella sp. C78]|uniref:Cof-type HAD-IIB family hydrolase n=1 Tax=Acidocella sp. C78 TaxID=1671486 RepID=UPI00191BB193|nr:Cof-type HAD-IIB family hydrolase [Acidocella sp. C78]